MMRRVAWSFVVVLTLAVGLSVIALSEAAPKDVKFPGAYSTAADFGNGMVFRGLTIFTDEGTMIGTNIAEFGGFDFGTGPTLNTEWFGVWEKTGPRSLVVTYYFYRAAPADGVVIGVTKGTAYCDWDKGEDAGTCTYVVEGFPCPGGPLTCPEPADLPRPSAVSGTFTFRRLPVF